MCVCVCVSVILTDHNRLIIGDGREMAASVKRCAEGVARLCAALADHDAGLERELLPLLEAEAARLESAKRTIRYSTNRYFVCPYYLHILLH